MAAGESEHPDASVRDRFDAIAASFDARGEALDARARELGSTIAKLTAEVDAVDAGSAAADRLDGQIIEGITSVRQELKDALDEWRAPSEVPELPPAAADDSVLSGPRGGADEAAARVAAAAARQQALEREAAFRWRRVEVAGAALERFMVLRTKGTEKISAARRAQVLGVTRQGVEQLQRELEQLVLSARLHLARRQHELSDAPRLFHDVFTVGDTVTRLLLALLVLVGGGTVLRRWRRWLEVVRPALVGMLPGMGWKHRLDRLLSAGEVAAPWSLFLLIVWALRRALGPAASTPELDLVLDLAMLFGTYRLAVELTTAALLRVADRYRLTVSSDRRNRLLASVRAILRVGALLGVILLVTTRWLGHGVLYHLASRFAWLVLLLALLGELLRWRRVMVDAFLTQNPDGRLAAAVHHSRGRWFGVVVAPAAMLWLAGRGVAVVGRDFALGFEQTQKALAFLFRRRIEKHAEREGYAEGRIDALPESVREAFAEDAVDRGPLVVGNFPGLAALDRRLSEWRGSGGSGALLVTGERGGGKTTWLNQITRDDLEIRRITLGGRMVTPKVLMVRLAAQLGIDGADGSPGELAADLNAGDRRIVVLDVAQHLFLATVGGYEAFAAFAGLVSATRTKVFWVVSMSAYAWRHLVAVRPETAVFRSRVQLGGWSEERIRELIRVRRAASRCDFDFAGLVVDDLEGVSAATRLVESEEGFTRLLWDYADGNPRVALHFFLRSLDPAQGNRLRVRLFRAPEPGQLEAAGEGGLFVLAAVVTHESISFEDLVRVVHSPEGECRIHVDRYQDLGAIVETEGLWRVSTGWHRAVVRLLKRRNLLPS